MRRRNDRTRKKEEKQRDAFHHCGATRFSANRLDLEVQRDESKHKALDVLNQVVENTQTVGILAALHLHQMPDLRCAERNVLVVQHDFQLLFPDAIRLWPVSIVLFEDFTTGDDTLQFVQHRVGNDCLLPDHGFLLVVGVVGVTEFPVRTKLKLQKLVSVLPFVSDVVS